ncbi:ABC transporter ATP-binding protein [Meiothermus ruber]|jgi:simple sugar transport system ATP-binding protein|uniref:ABC transporter n=1 Tax=Meiothermus ruber (strain ATCC 35948 / DSM 1279 / VKM B-1258 / 21) TaxID=504728 RepID=D3PRY6_MEIRD|nr:ABC transporter ATP-binding protein [Meiothermus ruber]ADD28219.1 ABC transporter related protein [Meiothermus ruber DSM 1279]AGK06343.1 ABC transporter [Meiothermus ruber DSM 1279]MCL6528932.1 ABC transporter ATP-binding protein [Meiothermus ruber]GAO75160.1 ABC transporter [Meiothermus ruber H328]
MSALLELKNITKRFPGVVANDGVSLEVYPGEVLALLGENGAGKSTLISILYGLYRPDEGEIRVEGRLVRIASPMDALRLGIGLVPQHPTLVGRHTVAENLALGIGSPFFPVQRIGPLVERIAQGYGLQIDPRAPVHQLSPGEKQRVEIVRALLRGAKVLILDEPTSVLTPQEAEALFRVMRELRAAGKSLIFISHKLEEVLSIADRCTVLRRGRVVGSLPREEASKPRLAELMVGRSVSFERKRQSASLGEVVLEVEDLKARSSRNLPALRGVSFTLRGGEILGLAGVAGNGQSELVEVLAGLRSIEAGSVRLLGQPLPPHPARLFDMGVAHIPEDRIQMGTVPSMSVAENLALRTFDRPPWARGGLLNPRAFEEEARQQVQAYAIATPSLGTPSRLLSGGNIQKVILARELAGKPRLILAVHPTYGLDIGATEQVHRVLLEKTQQGAAVLLVSEDLEELLSLSDRIGVLYRGALQGPFAVEEVSREAIGLWMTGGAA